MTKECPECKRELEFNEINFRRSCDGFWRNKCRDCQNRRKRDVYRSKKERAKKPEAYRPFSNPNTMSMYEKYERILELDAQHGLSEKEYISFVLASRRANKGIQAAKPMVELCVR